MPQQNRPLLPCQAVEAERALTGAQPKITTNGLHRLYQQACRAAIKASQWGLFDLSGRFGRVARRLETLLALRGVVI